MKWFLLLLSVSAWAHEERRDNIADFSGEGIIKAKPDFISLTLVVHSQCYATPEDAQKATDAVVKHVFDYLGTFKRLGDEHFKRLVDGGYTSTYSRIRDKQEYCRNTFQKNTTITLKIGLTDDFDRIFSEIQTKVLKHKFVGNDDQNADFARTFVTVGAPMPDITKEHRITLGRDALDLALKDAKANFKAAIKSCDAHRWKIIGIKQGENYNYPMARARLYVSQAANVGTADEAAGAPVRFNVIEIAKTLSVTFQFEGSLCYEP